MNDVTSQQTLQAKLQIRQALAPVVARYAEAARQLHAAFQPLIERVEQCPELLDQWRLQAQSEADAGSCRCLCGVHRDQAEGVCRGEAQPGVTFTFHSPTVGTQRVPMCLPCHSAHVERAADPLAASPDAMRVTFA